MCPYLIRVRLAFPRLARRRKGRSDSFVLVGRGGVGWGTLKRPRCVGKMLATGSEGVYQYVSVEVG